eukprot:166832-Pleurochrysis_carterae.AAC.1
MIWTSPPEPHQGAHAEARQLTYAPPPRTMRSVAEMSALLACGEAPTEFVGCESRSGAERDALVASGRRALSCDVR